MKRINPNLQGAEPDARLAWNFFATVPVPNHALKKHLHPVFAMMASLFLACASLAQDPAPATNEYAVKAAFLYHFAQFVEWPAEAFRDANSPLNYCTIGENPFHGSLDSALEGKVIGTRAIRVLHLKEPQEIPGCRILFVGAAEKKILPGIFSIAKTNSVLTVGESEHFAQEGGMIGFLLEENKIRFEVNLDAAQNAQLKISSRLLTLAKSVIGGQRGA